jgi:predicted PurR-regulated permease PerM
MRRALIARLRPERQREVLTIWEIAIAKTGGYVYSRVLIAVASAAFHTAVFWLIGLPYPAALGVWVGVVSSLIPVVGTYLAGLLPIAVALGDRPILAVWVVLVVVVYQQVENYLVSPRITARTMELHPAIAFLSVLAGAALLGAVGALLALPVAAVTAAVISAAGERHEMIDHELLVEAEDEGDPDEPSVSGSTGA